MASVNRAILLGNLGRDPETRYTAGGAAITSFSIATTRTWKGNNEQKQEETEWHRITCFGKLAEIASEYLRKGRPVYIEGRLHTRKWQDKDGNDRWTTEIVAEGLQLLGGRRDEEEPGERSERRDESPPNPAKRDGDIDNDIPF